MALQAPAHAERLDLVNLVHLVDPAVASDAADAASHMGAVVEVGDSRAGRGLAPTESGLPVAQLSRTGNSSRAVRRDPLVAVHADARRRHGREGGLLDRRVAVAAVHAQLARVQRVAEEGPAGRACNRRRSSGASRRNRRCRPGTPATIASTTPARGRARSIHCGNTGPLMASSSSPAQSTGRCNKTAHFTNRRRRRESSAPGSRKRFSTHIAISRSPRRTICSVNVTPLSGHYLEFKTETSGSIPLENVEDNGRQNR